MNKTEAEFAALLETFRLAGEFERWDFEPEKLRLADRTFYTPDFRAIKPNGEIVFYEVKGFMRDDAAVKIKVAADIHPYRFILVKKIKGGWSYNEV
jgi:hypothetical protein